MDIYKKGEPISWEEFLSKTKELKNQTSNEVAPMPWLFRGQANVEWGLETSLERYLKDLRYGFENGINLVNYYRIISRIVDAVSSLSERTFQNIDEIDLQHLYDLKSPCELPHMEFLCYLRHHGFPTPLLDWTKSQYIASYFAFSGTGDSDVAIFAYQNNVESGWTGEPSIHTIQEYLTAHKRHFNQQSNYTYCASFNPPLFMPHENAILCCQDSPQIVKFVIKGREKNKVLSELMNMNINSYSLFGNEEGLLKDLAFKERVNFRDLS